MTLPIPPNVFADGELVTEASLYARIFTAINTIYAQQLADEANALPEVASTISGGYVAGTPVLRKIGILSAVNTNASSQVTVTFPTSFPHGLIGIEMTSGTQAAPQLVYNTPSTANFIIVAKSPTGGAYASSPLTCTWQATGW